jgi:hypothetical protein
MKILILLSMFLISCGSQESDSKIMSSISANSVENDFGLTNVYDKAINDTGKGIPELYGTRNFRVVLKHTLYRSGANNTYLPNPRSNMNPLPPIALENLCKAGIQTAVYNYTTNFSTAEKNTVCLKNSLRYLQIDPKSKPYELLTLVKWHIDNNKVMLDHCWNGWHNSGLASSYSLMQFCGWNNTNALAYWMKNTDGNNGVAYESIKKRIRNFKPYSDLLISSTKQKEICFFQE